jgi:hypothetical protein
LRSKRDVRTKPVRLGHVVQQCLREGNVVEIDGLGVFRPLGQGKFAFVAESAPSVFLAYVEEDLPRVRKLFDALAAAGFKPWLDKRDLMPGQNWPRSIQGPISVSDFFIACFSRRTMSKRGTFHAELRYAIDCASEIPIDEIFLIPTRLEPCDVPPRIAEQIHYVDLCPNWEKRVKRIVAAVHKQMRLRRKRRLLAA